MKSKQDWTARRARGKAERISPPFSAKASDLGALREAVVDAASVSGGLWLSYLFVLLYLLIAAGSVTHRDLFFEHPVKLPFLNVELPLLGFFVLGPLMFLIVHTYVLLHFALLADKVGALDVELQAQIADDGVRARLRRQLPSNIFVQVLAGPREMRTGIVGFLLRLVSQISLVLLPLVMLIFFQLQFLPYHSEPISWWQRIAVVIDLTLLWILWPSIARGENYRISWPDFRRRTVAASVLASCVPLFLVFGVSTFSGEFLDKLPSVPIVPLYVLGGEPASGASGAKPKIGWHLTSLHDLLVAGSVDLVSRRPQSLWSNVLVLPGIDIGEDPRFDSEEKIAKVHVTYSLRGRDLRGAILIGARLRKVDFTGAQLEGAVLSNADLREASFLCDQTNYDDTFKVAAGSNLPASVRAAEPLQDRCADLTRANLSAAQLQGAQLGGASFSNANLQGAQFHGADAYRTNFENANLEGAKFYGTNAPLADFSGANLEAASFFGSLLLFADLDNADLRGAGFAYSDLSDALFQGACVWKTMLLKDPMIGNGDLNAFEMRRQPRGHCDWSAQRFSALRRDMRRLSPPFDGRTEFHDIWGIEDSDFGKFEQALKDPYSELDGSAEKTEFLSIACLPAGAPFVVHGLIKTVDAIFDKPGTDLLSGLADEGNCHGAHGLSAEDKTALRELIDEAARATGQTEKR